MLEYTIVEKPQFTLVGYARTFHYDTSYQEIPKFWTEVFAKENCPLMGMFGVCLGEENSKEFTYLIADNYIPWKEVPQGCVTQVIPAATWAVFPCRGPIPQNLQALNTRIWSQWLPENGKYKLATNMDIEMYAPPEEQYCEIWLPVTKL